jgi:hypothetical protein
VNDGFRPQTNPNLSDKPRRVLRGGSWAREPKNTRSAARFRADPGSRNADIGFRVVAEVDPLPRPAARPEPPAPPVERTGPGPASGPSAHTGPVFPPPHPEGSSRRAIGIGFPFVGLLCFLVPLVAGVLLVLAVLRGISRRTQGAGSAQQAGAAMARAMAAGAARGTDLHARIRPTEDGFWLHLDVPPGTRVRYRFRPGSGMPVTNEVSYQPGPEGHFIYTGLAPTEISVLGLTGGDEVGEEIEPPWADGPVVPPLPDQGPEDADDRGSGRSGGWFGGASASRPPRNPAAY